MFNLVFVLLAELVLYPNPLGIDLVDVFFTLADTFYYYYSSSIYISFSLRFKLVFLLCQDDPEELKFLPVYESKGFFAPIDFKCSSLFISFRILLISSNIFFFGKLVEVRVKFWDVF